MEHDRILIYDHTAGLIKLQDSEHCIEYVYITFKGHLLLNETLVFMTENRMPILLV